MSALTQILFALAAASTLFVDCQASSSPSGHMARAIARNAPSTLERYFDQWIRGAAIATRLVSIRRHLRPVFCPIGWLPVLSAQGLATAPLKALSWMCKTAGLPSLCEALSSALPCLFPCFFCSGRASESLPLSLSFVVWLEQICA